MDKLYYDNKSLESLPGEEWKPSMWSNNYSVSNLGRIRSEERKNPLGRRVRARILTQTVVQRTLRVNISLGKRGQRKTTNVSNLVGNLFLSGVKPNDWFDKLNGDFRDCRAVNLKICRADASNKDNKSLDEKVQAVGKRLSSFQSSNGNLSKMSFQQRI